MAKHNLEVEPDEGYELVQVISEERGTFYMIIVVYSFVNYIIIYIFFPHPSELVIPDNANVFYAMNTSANFDFLLRVRGSAGGEVQLRSRCSSTLPRAQHRSSLSIRLSKVAL